MSFSTIALTPRRRHVTGFDGTRDAFTFIVGTIAGAGAFLKGDVWLGLGLLALAVVFLREAYLKYRVGNWMFKRRDPDQLTPH